jgi:hypothetical protein
MTASVFSTVGRKEIMARTSEENFFEHELARTLDGLYGAALRLTKNPDDAESLFEYLDHELEENEHEAMDAHLHECRRCFSRAEFEKRLKARLAQSGSEAPLTAFGS